MYNYLEVPVERDNPSKMKFVKNKKQFKCFRKY